MKFTLVVRAGEFTCNFLRPVNDDILRPSLKTSSGCDVLIFMQRNTTASNRWRNMQSRIVSATFYLMSLL